MALLSSIFDKAKDSIEALKKQNSDNLSKFTDKLDSNTAVTPITKENGVDIWNFPIINDDDARAKKTIRLIVLKQQAWKDIEDIASETVKNFLNTTEEKDEKGVVTKTNTVLGNLKDSATAFTEAWSSRDFKKGLDSIIKGTKAVTDPFEKAIKTALPDISNPVNYSSSQIECVFQLPIPNNLLESENHNYTGGKFDDSEVVSAVTKPYGEIAKLVDSAAQMTGQMLQGDARRTARPVPQMPVLNPFLYQKYEGSETKEYSLVFFLVPRNKEEAQQAMKISYLLKKYSYPSKATIKGDNEQLDTVFLTPPNKILIKFQNDYLQKLINPGVCVIKTIQTTYNEGTTVGMTADGVPRFIEINMTLAEYNQKYQEDFK